MRILLQFPEGLKKNALQISNELEKEGHTVFISSSPCYGGCDLAMGEGIACKAAKIVHYGHSKFVKGKGRIPVEYKEYRIDAPLSVLPKTIPFLKDFGRVGIVTTVQHVHQIGEIRKFFEKNGKKVFVGKGKKTAYPGQVLGCDAGAAKGIEKDVDCILYFGGGSFHPIGIDVKKPVLAANPFSGDVRWVDEEIERARKRRKGMLIKAASGKVFGVLVSTKTGQFNLKEAERAKRALEKKGKVALMLISNEVRGDSVKNFNFFDAYINTACPRLEEDYELFGKPVVNSANLDRLLELIG